MTEKEIKCNLKQQADMADERDKDLDVQMHELVVGDTRTGMADRMHNFKKFYKRCEFCE